MASGQDALRWLGNREDRSEVARFFARVIGGDARYISHGEIQCGLSEDGESWSPQLEQRFVEDLSQPYDDSSVLVLMDDAGATVAAAIVAWTVTPRVSFATIEDMAVDPAARSSGLGARMMAAIEAEARRRGMRWLFLESGKDNHLAHGFFERHGFHTVSHVFSRRL